MSQRLSWMSIPDLVRVCGDDAEVGEDELEEVEDLQARVEDEGAEDAAGFEARRERARSRVVLPVPTSPVRTMNPLCAQMPYSSVARASRVCGIRTRKRGSGLSANGVLWRWKKLLYMVIPGHRRVGLFGACG